MNLIRYGGKVKERKWKLLSTKLAIKLEGNGKK